MKKVTRLTAIPENSAITNGFDKIDYHDTYQIQKKTEKSAEEISKAIMILPDWVVALFKLRNSIVQVFGLKTGRENKEQDTFFTLIEKTESEIVMGEIDKHLDFRASIMNDKSKNTISFTTVVHFNNVWGRIYFFPVKPFHKIIMKKLLKRYLKKH